MKAIVIVDLPNGIELDEYRAFINVERMSIPLGALGNEKIYSDYFKFKFKPLRPMPEKNEIKNEEEFMNVCGWMYEVQTGMDIGWNDCIDEIMGEAK